MCCNSMAIIISTDKWQYRKSEIASMDIMKLAMSQKWEMINTLGFTEESTALLIQFTDTLEFKHLQQ